jgi:protein-disulfide isomerase
MSDTNTPNPTTTSSKSGGQPLFFERFGTPIALLLGLVIVAGAIYFGGKFQPTATSQTASTTAAAVDIKTDGDPYIGNVNAPVTMALFFDYQCPFCKQFDQTVTSQLYTNYVQKGQLKIVFKDFDFIGPDSLVASEYARAVWELYPQQWYAWYTAMFAAQDTENTGFGDEASIKKLTAGISGIDATKVAALVATKKTAYDATAQASFQEGQSYGIQGTPSVIIGTTLLQGAQTYQAVAGLVDAQLKK